MSAPGNTAKLGIPHDNLQKAQSCPALVGIDLQFINHRTILSHHIIISSQLEVWYHHETVFAENGLYLRIQSFLRFEALSWKYYTLERLCLRQHWLQSLGLPEEDRGLLQNITKSYYCGSILLLVFNGDWNIFLNRNLF